MNTNSVSTPMAILGFSILGGRIVKWVVSSIVEFYITFRATTAWLLLAIAAIYFGTTTMVLFAVFVVLTSLIAFVELPEVVRNISLKVGEKNEKITNALNKTADILDKVYPQVRKAVRLFSFVPDFQRAAAVHDRQVGKRLANEYFYSEKLVQMNDPAAKPIKWNIYLMREKNGKVVRNQNEEANYVFYLGKGCKVLPPGFTVDMLDGVMYDLFLNKFGAQDIREQPLTKSRFFSKRYEFVSDMPQEIVEGNEFIRIETDILKESDYGFYDVKFIRNHDGYTVEIGDILPNSNIRGISSKMTEWAETRNIKYVIIKQAVDGLWLKAEFLTDVSYEIDRANDLLRATGIVDKTDKTLYDATMFDNNNGNPTIVIQEQIGYKTIEDVYQSLVKIRSNYGSKYVDLKKKESENDPWITFEYVRTIDPDVERAHDLLKEANVINRDSAEIIDISMSINEDEAVFKLNEYIYGKSTRDIVGAVESFKERFGAKVVRSITKTDGSTEVLFVIKDFLDEGKLFDGIPPLNLDNISIPSAVDPFGKDYYMSFSEVAGAVIMGQPGSGKTASALVFLSAIAASDDTVFDLIDCKGGADWNTISAGIDNHIKGAYSQEDLEAIEEYLESLEVDMNNRIKEMEDRLGYSSFWDKDLTAEDRRKAGVKYRMLVVDECQDLFGKTKAGAGNKELNALYTSIETRLINLVKKGRSSGITVVFITQKPTQTSLPTDIRDNCAIRISFKVNSQNLANLFFGTEPYPGQPSPVSIPKSRQGGAVLFNDDTQEFDEVRFYYIKPKNMKEYMEAAVSGERKESKWEKDKKEKAKQEENKRKKEEEEAYEKIRIVKEKEAKEAFDNYPEKTQSKVRFLKSIWRKSIDKNTSEAERLVAREKLMKQLKEYEIEEWVIEFIDVENRRR